MFYAVKAPGNQGNAGPLAKAGSQGSGSSFPIYQPQRFYYQRLNPAYGSITDILSETNSSYSGAMVRLIRRLSRTLTVNAGYTWSHAIDDGQNEATFADRNDVYDPADLRLDHGTSNYDARQRVAGGLVLREPWRLRGTAGVLFSDYALSATGDWRAPRTSSTSSGCRCLRSTCGCCRPVQSRHCAPDRGLEIRCRQRPRSVPDARTTSCRRSSINRNR